MTDDVYYLNYLSKVNDIWQDIDYEILTFYHKCNDCRRPGYGHPSHCYKGRSLLFDHRDLEGESRLEMTGSTTLFKS